MIGRWLAAIALIAMLAVPLTLFAPTVKAQDSPPTPNALDVALDQELGWSVVLWDPNPMSGDDPNKVSIVALDSGAVLQNFEVSPLTSRLAVRPDTRDAYLLVGQQVQRLDLVTGALETVVDLPAELTVSALVIHPLTNKLYVAGTIHSEQAQTVVIDLIVQAQVNTIPYEVRAVDTKLNRLYAGEIYLLEPPYQRLPALRLVALDGATEAPMPGNPIFDEAFPYDIIDSILINPATSRLYVQTRTCYAKCRVPVLRVVDTQTNKVLSTADPSPLEHLEAINIKENKLYGPRIFGGLETAALDAASLAEKGRWLLRGCFVGVDPGRNLSVILPTQRTSNGLTLWLANGANDTFQRVAVITPASGNLGPFQPVGSFASSADHRYFPETGHSVSFGFKTYWERNGGLAVFGFPISQELVEVNPADLQSYTVQYFERARFEYHPQFAGTPYEVELGLLGRQFAMMRAPLPNTGTSAQVAYFPETGQYLAYGFKYYWERNGGVAIFGFPTTGEFVEVNPIDGKPYTVQYFERARFEYHPEFKGTPYETELGLLGRQALQAQGLP